MRGRDCHPSPLFLKGRVEEKNLWGGGLDKKSVDTEAHLYKQVMGPGTWLWAVCTPGGATTPQMHQQFSSCGLMGLCCIPLTAEKGPHAPTPIDPIRSMGHGLQLCYP